MPPMPYPNNPRMASHDREAEHDPRTYGSDQERHNKKKKKRNERNSKYVKTMGKIAAIATALDALDSL